jgi:hypothetical protein
LVFIHSSRKYNRNDVVGAEDTLKLIDSASRDVINLLKKLKDL